MHAYYLTNFIENILCMDDKPSNLFCCQVCKSFKTLGILRVTIIALHMIPQYKRISIATYFYDFTNIVIYLISSAPMNNQHRDMSFAIKELTFTFPTKRYLNVSVKFHCIN